MIDVECDAEAGATHLITSKILHFTKAGAGVNLAAEAAQTQSSSNKQRPSKRKLMTVCVAVICENGRAIVLASDKKIGKGFVETEPEITKIRLIHPQWFLMISGDDISPLFDLVDLARAELPTGKPATLADVTEVIQRNYELIRIKRAEAFYLKPRGLTLARFINEGTTLLSDSDYTDIKFKLEQYDLSVEILVAGFDVTLDPPAKIFTMSSNDRGVPMRRDIPGFAAIGSGAIGAEFMMFFKEVGLSLPIRAAVYYAVEAKYFGEYGAGVGEKTDMFVLRFNGQEVGLVVINDEKTIEKKLIPMCERLEPRHPENEDIEILNNLRELRGLPMIPAKKKKSGRPTIKETPSLKKPK